MKIRKFEELECWKEARELVKKIYRVINNPPEKVRKIIDGLLRYLKEHSQRTQPAQRGGVT